MSQKRQAIYFKDTSTGKEPAKEWIRSLKDNLGKAKILTRIERAENGNVGAGIFELKIDYGPGYRVYYAFDGHEIILLLVAGDKSTQKNDIEKAKFYWAIHKKEEN